MLSALINTKIDLLKINNRSERCIPIKLLVTTFDNYNSYWKMSLHAYKMSPDPNPNPNSNRDNPNNLLNTIILSGYNVRIG